MRVNRGKLAIPRKAIEHQWFHAVAPLLCRAHLPSRKPHGRIVCDSIVMEVVLIESRLEAKYRLAELLRDVFRVSIVANSIASLTFPKTHRCYHYFDEERESSITAFTERLQVGRTGAGKDMQTHVLFRPLMSIHAIALLSSEYHPMNPSSPSNVALDAPNMASECFHSGIGLISVGW